MGALDPASLQILLSRLRGIADEMGAVLQRAGFSPNIKERADFSAAVFGPDGQMLAQAEHLPVHLGSMPASVAAAIAFAADPATGPIVEGDHIIVNDPFAGGTHLNDITIVTPAYHRGDLIGWAANRAHHADVGGAAPGSIPADATEIYQEGLRLPPLKLTDEVRAILAANSRTPVERAGDLDAQVGANRVGVQRLVALAGEPFDAALEYGERRMRSVLAALPDGEWTFEDVVDSFGPAPHQQVSSRIAVRMTLRGDTIRFDFRGTDPQRLGNVNTVEAVTVSSVVFAVRAALAPTVPANAGALRPIEILVPEGSLLNARPPAAVGAGNVEVSQRVADVCLGAIASMDPSAVGAASQGTMNNVLIGGAGRSGTDEIPWVYYETVGGGQGGRPFGAGMSGIHTAMTNTKNTPVEAFERAFPMRVVRQRLRRGSGGEGAAPGGEGIERDLQVLVDATVSLITERRVSQPWGLAGGEPGAVGENWLVPGGDETRAERLPDKCTIQLKSGDVLRMLTPGGGGWGARHVDQVEGILVSAAEVVGEHGLELPA